ncbi:MAG: hypothetical protein V4450_00085 [Bacteroidota bacterium]
MSYLRIDLFFLFIATSLGFITIRSANRRYQYLLPFFLLLTLSVEMVGILFQKKGQNNLALFNLFSTAEFFFFTLFFYEVLENRAIQKTVGILLYVLPLACLINIFFIQGLRTFHTYTFASGSMIMVALSIVSFSQIYRKPEIQHPIRHPSFWVTCAILFFFSTSVSIIGIFNYVAVLSKQMVHLSKIFLLSIDCIFYFLFIIAFICQKNFRKSIPNL